jgi:hypothetical protein
MKLVTDKKFETLVDQRIKAFVDVTREEQRGKAVIVPMPSPLEPAKVSDWRTALQSARARMMQARTTLYDKYQDAIDTDSHLRGLMEKRIMYTTGKTLEFADEKGEPIPSVTDFINSPDFNRFRRLRCERKIFWGIGLFGFEIMEFKGKAYMTFEDYPPKHIDPYALVIRKDQNVKSDADISFANQTNLIMVGSKDDYGLLLQLSLLSIEKRDTINHWRRYTADAGKSLINAQLRGDADNSAIQEVLDQIGARETAHRKGEVEIKTETLSSSSQNQLFENRVKYFEDAMTKLVLGQTMTTESGASYSQSEVHERQQESIFDADAKAELDFLNFDFYELNEAYSIPNGGEWMYKLNTSGKAAETLEVDKGLKELGFNFTQQYLSETYGRPLNIQTDADNETE